MYLLKMLRCVIGAGLILICCYFKVAGQVDSSFIQSIQSINQEKDILEKVNLLNDFSIKLSSRGHHKIATEYANDALKTSRRAHSKRGEAGANSALGIIYFYQNNYEKSILQFYKSLSIDEEINNKVGIASNYNNMANVYLSINKPKRALSCLNKSLKLYKLLGDQYGIASVYNNMGIIYETIDLTKSIHYTELSSQIFQSIQKTQEFLETLSNLSKYNYKKKNFQKSNYYFDRIVRIASSKKNYASLSKLYNLHGENYLNEKEFDKAKEFFDKALANAIRSKDKRSELKAYTNLGEYFSRIKKVKESIKFSDKALNIAREINSPQSILEISKLLYEFYEKNNDYKNVNHYFKLYSSQKDLINSQQIMEVELLYKYSKSEKENELLTTEKNLASAKIARNRIIMIAVSLTLILLLILYIININRLKAYKMIVKRNMEIAGSEIEMENIKVTRQVTNEEKLSEVIHRKYASSKLKDDEKSKLFKKLIEKIEIEKVYLDSELTLKSLADNLETNSKYLSQVINESFDQSFYNFINEYRVKEARNRISTQSHYTIEHIASEVGFNSKSSFNTAFKKHIGVTPSFYLNSSKNILKESKIVNSELN